jgi:hypothetical protein
MADPEGGKESFAEFKSSFSYGSRNDLNFKFLASLSDADAASFLQELLWKLGDCLNDGAWDRLLAHLIDGQVRGYAAPGRYVYREGPFRAPSKPLSESTLALLSSSGHFVEGDDPRPFGVADMSQEEAVRRIDEFLKAEPQLSAIPKDTPRERLRVRHGGYDLRGALADPNVVFPLEPLRRLEGNGAIGGLLPRAYSFVGACAQTRLLKESGPQWVALLKQQSVDCALLVPA